MRQPRSLLPPVDLQMISHDRDTAIHPYPEYSQGCNADTSLYALIKPAHLRVHTYAAHALVLFTIYGVLFSSGLWLEYYFTSLHPTTSLLAISAIFGAQLCCFSLAVGATVLLYRQWPRSWRLQLFAGILSVCGAKIGPLIADDFWVLAMCQGALTGLGIGVCATISTLVLSTHYKNDIAITSTRCAAAGFFGLLVYTGLTWPCLRVDAIKLAHGMTLFLPAITMLPSLFIAKPSSTEAENPPVDKSTRSRAPLPMAPFMLLSTFLLPSALILPPLYLPLILTRHPSAHRADIAAYILFTLATTALFSSALLPQIPPHRLSPITLFAASVLLTAVAMIPLVWTTSLGVAVTCAAVFGMGLGGGCALGVRVVVGRGRGNGEDGGKWRWMMLVIAGVGVGAGVLGAAAVLERRERGVQIVLGAVAVYLGMCGVLVGGVVGAKYWRGKRAD